MKVLEKLGFMEEINQKIDSLKVVDFKREVEVSGKFIELFKGEYLLNNNEWIMRETVAKKVGSGNAVAIFAVTCDKKILLVIQPRVSLDTDTKINIELPAGYIEYGEEDVLAGMRELGEETGYFSKSVKKVDEYYPSLGASGEKITLLLALDCEKVKKLALDSDEYLDCVSVSLEEFKYLMDNGYIKDVNARIGYYKYLEYLRK